MEEEIKNTRLFLGNLPPSITEKEITKKFKEFGKASDLEIQRRLDHLGNVTSTFAHLTIDVPQDSVYSCLKSLNSQIWDDFSIKAQVAKDSYHKRMLLKRQSDRGPSDTITTFPVSGTGPGVDSEKKSHLKSPSARDNKELPKTKATERQSHLPDDDSDSGLFWGETQSTAGTVSFDDTSERKRFNKPLKNYDSNSENKLMEKFESYSSVWNDSTDVQYRSSEDGRRRSFNQRDERNWGRKRSETFPEHSQNSYSPFEAFRKEVRRDTSGYSKKQLADERRLKSLDERKYALEAQHLAVSQALTMEPKNKKIKFGDDDVLEAAESQKSRLKLFDDEDDQLLSKSPKDDFKIRKQFEGRRGEKLLELQSKFASDDRFRLDARFAESDSDQEDERGSLEEPDDEAEIPKSHKSSQRQEPKIKSFVRFDPSNPEHTSFKIQVESNKKKKRKMAEENEVVQNSETPMPEVSKERFYEVSTNLQDTLAPVNAACAFSLRSLFDQDSQDVDSPDPEYTEEFVEKEKNSKRKVKNPFEKQRDDEISAPSTSKVEKPPRSTWQETFFFKPNDERLTEGLKFFNSAEYESTEAFQQRRQDLWATIKSKVRNVSKKKQSFEHNLGSRAFRLKKKGSKQPRFVKK